MLLYYTTGKAHDGGWEEKQNARHHVVTRRELERCRGIRDMDIIPTGLPLLQSTYVVVVVTQKRFVPCV
jgi:hypothetical protein